MTTNESAESVALENTVRALGLMVDSSNHVIPVVGLEGEVLERSAASLLALRDALVRCFPLDDNDTVPSSSSSVLFALNNETQEWSRHGFTGKDWRYWQVYGFSPQSAGEWRALGVDIEKALFYRDAGLRADMYVKWASVHNAGEFDDPATHNLMFQLISMVGAMKEVTTAGAHRWVERDINLWDMREWLRAGYTPAKAQAAIEGGTTVADLAGVDDALVPGASWPKMQKAMAKYGWTFSGSSQSRWAISVDWKKDNNNITANFTHAGRISSFHLWSLDPQGRRARRWLPHYGYRGVKNFLALVKDESEGVLVDSGR